MLVVAMGLGMVQGLFWERILTADLLLVDMCFMYLA